MGKARLVILGTGFGAFALLRRIDPRAYHVTVVSPRNHFLFTPLLPSTTVGTVADPGRAGANLSGFWVYQQWRAAVWTQLISTRSRVLVPLGRFRAFVFGRDINRL